MQQLVVAERRNDYSYFLIVWNRFEDMILFDLGANLHLAWIGLVLEEGNNVVRWGVLTVVEKTV